MHLRTRLHRFFLYLACLSFVWAALSPALMQGLINQKWLNPEWVELCTRSGMVYAKVDAPQVQVRTLPAGAVAASLSADHFEHCPFCQHSAAPLAVLPAALPFFITQGYVLHARAVALQRHAAALVWWRLPPSRAPPAA